MFAGADLFKFPNEKENWRTDAVQMNI